MLEKIKKQMVKREKLLVFILILFAVSAFAFNVKLDSNDELWNFSNIYKMANGRVIYRDLNVIITPLFFYIGKIIFQILAILTTMYWLIYRIYSVLEVKGKRNIFYLILIYILMLGVIQGGANYNFLAIDLCLFGILCILQKKSNYMQGLIIFLVFMTKQNIGVYYAMGYALYCLVENKNLIKAIKKALPAFIITITLIGIYLGYLATNNNLYNFIKYTFLGIRRICTRKCSM